MPHFDLAWRPTASPHSLLDVKGVGELSSIGGPGPIINAVLNALASRGVQHLDLPLHAQKNMAGTATTTPYRIRLLQ
jgi:carbon-monoxide dehydrogenase large subunit